MSNDPGLYQGPYSGTPDEKEVEVPLYDANRGKVPRTGGPYRDELEREEAEKQRAKLEDREPDLDNPPATAATHLVPESQLREADTDKSHYSDFLKVENDPFTTVKVDTTSAFDADPDPAQADWDNDQSKVDALRVGAEYQELKDKAEKSAKPEKSETSSPPAKKAASSSTKSDS